ncbi:MAG: peptidoglycan-associated lipoprotein Pal [Thermaurantiacus tibetensis]|uniref:peptidoglycan-associated lipoprotein Pal n=1 Tax=Thermaurantiacus tibetensis TaxID=2759035 RepID=UPI00188F56CD|nr:peptidoglycan-associated lipoprotein Pal [Thermaurantiacus tibetensis]
MSRRLALALVAATVALAGCARKREDLPPPPPPATAPVVPAEPVPPPPAVGTTAVPGSMADFLARAGSDRVFFGFDRYDLDADARATLDRQAAWLRQYPAVRVTIEGHADERGTREYNLALGERRANAVRTYLAANGVAASRMTVISYGKERPAVDGSNEEAWAQNRRAVTVLVSGMAG